MTAKMKSPCPTRPGMRICGKAEIMIHQESRFPKGMGAPTISPTTLSQISCFPPGTCSLPKWLAALPTQGKYINRPTRAQIPTWNSSTKYSAVYVQHRNEQRCDGKEMIRSLPSGLRRSHSRSSTTRDVETVHSVLRGYTKNHTPSASKTSTRITPDIFPHTAQDVYRLIPLLSFASPVVDPEFRVQTAHRLPVHRHDS
jgi:hypothetical protein